MDEMTVICSECGSTEIRRDAEVRWNADVKAWILTEWLGSFCWCANCEAEYDANDFNTPPSI